MHPDPEFQVCFSWIRDVMAVSLIIIILFATTLQFPALSSISPSHQQLPEFSVFLDPPLPSSPRQFTFPSGPPKDQAEVWLT